MNDNILVILIYGVAIFLISVWPYNLYKFVSCDFEPDYKCEAVHGIGIIVPPASFVTVFFGADE